MLNVSDAALARLARKLANRDAPDSASLRFKRTEGGWRLRLDRPRPDDAAFTHEGRKVLVLDQNASVAMDTMRLDVKQTKAGPRLKLQKAHPIES